MIDPSLLVNDVLRGVLGGRRKRSRRALRYLTGRRGGWMTHPTTLWTAAGLAWGIFDTLQNQGSPGSLGSQGGQGSGDPQGPVGPAGPLPSLPSAGGAASIAAPNDALRMVRLAISAANADGTMTDAERAAVAGHTQASGGADLVASELAQPRPLAEIVSGVTDPVQRSTLYVLAYTILRADEQVSGAERIYLAQLAHLLGLTPQDVQRLERDTNERIDAQQGGEGPPSGPGL